MVCTNKLECLSLVFKAGDHPRVECQLDMLWFPAFFTNIRLAFNNFQIKRSSLLIIAVTKKKMFENIDQRPKERLKRPTKRSKSWRRKSKSWSRRRWP